MRTLYGPGGSGHCSVFNCLEVALIAENYSIWHPSQERRMVRYFWCDRHVAHSPTRNPQLYPNFTLEKVVNI